MTGMLIIKKWLNKVYDFFKKYGVDAVIAIILFNFPMYGMIFIKDPGFIQFGTWWTALWWGLGPLTPGWLVTIILAVFVRWGRMQIWAAILWFREAMEKLQTQNQLMAYLTSEEIKMILDVAKRVEASSVTKRQAFAEKLRKERKKMLDEQWTKEVEK